MTKTKKVTISTILLKVLEILHIHLGNYFNKFDSPMLREIPKMRIFSLENIPLQIRAPPTNHSTFHLHFKVNYTSIRLVEVTHAWKPQFYHQLLHAFLSLPHM
jgi:hypothetical protein